MIKKITLAAIFSFFIIGEIFSQIATYTYTGKPRFQILTKRNNTLLGIINVELFPNIAPKHTRNFDSLVSKQFYDTTAFHRVIPVFMIQGGDPNSRHGPKPTWGQGQASQPTVNAEFTTAKHVRGILSAARDANINSANSQFFICHAAAASLNGQYSVYGRVTSGIKYVDTIVSAPRDANDNPFLKIEMFVTYIGSNDTVPNPPVLNMPTNGALGIDTMFQVLFKWNAQSDGIIYHYDLSTDSTFATTYKSADVGGLLYVQSTGLLSNTKYFWRVRTNNGGHFSVFSPVWHFTTTSPIMDVGLKKQNNTNIQPVIYPNPSAGKFAFSEIEIGSKIEVFDIAGKLISQTITTETTITINLEGKEKGIYTYRISTSKQEVKNGKLILK